MRDWKDLKVRHRPSTRMRWWMVLAMLVLTVEMVDKVEARRRKPGGTCGLSCYRSVTLSGFEHVAYQATIYVYHTKTYQSSKGKVQKKN